MKHRRLLFALCFSLAFLALFGSAASNYLSDYKSPARRFLTRVPARNFNPSASRRKPLSDSKESETALVAAVDGQIYLLELDSMKPLWSFASGPAIYSSYQAPVSTDNDKENVTGVESDYYIDCGDDWELYAHSRLGKLKLMKNLEEYVSSTPQIAEDGGIVLGSKQTRAFLVDGKTGRLIHTYKMPDSSNMSQNFDQNNAFHNDIVDEPGLPTSVDMQADMLPLYLTRTDYTLTSFAPNSNKILWNLTVAEIGAASLCQGIERSFDGALLDSDSSGVGFNMPLPCESRALVYRFRNQDIMEALSGPGQLTGASYPEKMLPASVAHDNLPSQPNVDRVLQFLPSPHNVGKVLDMHGSDNTESLPSVMRDSEISQKQKTKMPSFDGLGVIIVRIAFPLFCTTVLVVIGAYFNYTSFGLGELFSYKTSSAAPAKKKKHRKSGKNGTGAEKMDRDIMLDCQTSAQNGSGNDLWSSLKKPTSVLEGRTIGKLFVSNEEIAKGSNGTVVLEGFYEGRAVAVKRLVKAHHEVAFKEIQNLIASDRHPNIIRWYGVEHDRDFVYLSLERCICSLNDLIHIYSGISKNLPPNLNSGSEKAMQNEFCLNSVKAYLPDHKLTTTNGYPSQIVIKIMRDVVSGLVHLHELGIIHRDLKPQNILITVERSLCAKLSDMGISKRLVGDMSSLSQNGTGFGSSGWQAPEQLLHGRQTRAVDLFSLGCVLFYCMTGGGHPFGNPLERDVNIAKNQVDLFLVEHVPEAIDLFSWLLNPNPEMRPKAVEVLAHPLFWSAETRLSFLRDASDRVELEDREAGSELLGILESTAPKALGGKWDEKMEPAFINNIGRYRRYKYESVRDLLRVMRNKLNHYRELPKEIQEILGPVPEGFDGYFTSRFPKLLMEIYKILRVHCREEECFQKYFNSSQSSW